MDIENLKGRPAYFLLDLANDSSLSDDANQQLRAWAETVEYQIAEIERLKADIADLLPMRDVDAKIISDQAAKIEWLKAKLAVEKEHHDYAMRKLHKTTDQATDAGKAAAEVIEVALKLAAYPAPYLPPARLLNELREAGKAYRAAVQPDG